MKNKIKTYLKRKFKELEHWFTHSSYFEFFVVTIAAQMVLFFLLTLVITALKAPC